MTILLFATLAQTAGQARIDWEPTTTETLTAKQLWDALIEKFPNLANHETGLLVAVDQVFVKLDATIPPHAEVAFMPPVQGG